jgi:hypothetical protein
MAVLCLLLVVFGVGSKKLMLKDVKQRVQAARAKGAKADDPFGPFDPDDPAYLAYIGCLGAWEVLNPDAKEDSEEAYEAAGTCCEGDAEKYSRCEAYGLECEIYKSGEADELYDDDDKKKWDAICPAYCDALSSRPGWCGLALGVIIGIVVGSVVVVGVVVGLLVYFLVIKKKKEDG